MVTDMAGVHTPRCLLAALVLGAVLSACVPPPLGDSEAELALEDLASGDGTSRLKAQTPQPSRQTLRYPVADELRSADLYLSPAGARAGIVLVPGIVAQGKDDPRLVAMARTLARLRFAVLVPAMPGVRRYQVRARDVREVADAFAYLVSRPELAPPGHAGVAGFSYGAGPVIIAALQPDIRERVSFVLAVGGYYSLDNVVTYFTTGRYRRPAGAGGDGQLRLGYRPPLPYIKWAFIRSNLDLLEEPADRAFLSDYADQVMRGAMPDEEPLPAGLAADARAVYKLLINDDPVRVTALIARLPPRIRRELEGVNPAAHALSQLQARLILLHGRRDNMIPYTESIALANALPADRVQLFLIDGLVHVDLRPSARDIPQLVAAMQALLAERASTRE
jgi:pimeloyl-ACP methyl ester carboxylesterase